MPKSSLPMELLRLDQFGKDLSPEQRQVVKMLALGYTQREIADMQRKSIETVKKQSKMARARLGARTNAQLVGIAVSLDLV